MTVLTFPSSPIEGQVYNAPNGLRYVYDSVKWVVETTTSTSEAVTNSTQDRVAPIFVNGDHTGITFAYDAGTNTMSAEVTAVNGDRLINGAHELVLGADGVLTAPGTLKLPNFLSNSIEGDDGLSITSKNGNQLALGYNRATILNPNPDYNANVAVLFLDGSGATIEVNSDTTGNIWHFKTDGTIEYPGGIKQGYQDSTSCNSGVDTVIYTATTQWQHAIKLFVMVEGTPTGGTSWETQACDIIAVKGFVNDIVHVTAYGVTYSSASALATFDGQWNATTNRIEITCRPTSLTNSVTASVHTIEMSTND